MFTNSKLNKIITGLFSLLFLFPTSSSALDTPLTINGKCVSRIISFTASTAKPENGIQVNPAYGHVNIYVLNGSDFSYSSQDVSGILAKSPSQALYYDYRASTIIPGNYAGYDFAGNTNYLSMGSASLFFGSDTSYTCNGGAGTVLGGTSLLKSYQVSVAISTPGYNSGISATGIGFYKEGSQVTLSVPNIVGYVFDKWYGSCNSQSVVSTNYATKSVYYYTVSGLSANCVLTANYVKQEQVFSTLFHRLELSTSGGGTVTISGQTSASATGSIAVASVRDGDTVTYSTNADSGYTFTGWSGSLYGYGASGSVISDRDKQAQATFTFNGLTSSTTVTCVDVPGTITVSTNPYGAGAIHIDYPAPLNVTGGVNLSSTHLGTTYSGSNGNSCSNGFLIEPRAFSGYTFTGWSGDTNVATGTIANLISDNRLRKGDWITANKTVTANFEYNGVANENGEVPVTLVEPVFNPVSDTIAQLFDFNPQTPISRSPLTIDSQCVNTVLQFEGTRMASDGSGFLGFVTKYIPVQILNVFTAPTHTYIIYSLEGSTLTQSQDTGLVTFKSSPSNFIYAYDSPVVAPGDYQSSNQNYFTGTADSYTFKNFHKIQMNKYDCSHGDESLTVKEMDLIPSHLRLFQGYSYAYAHLSTNDLKDCGILDSGCGGFLGVLNPYDGDKGTSTALYNDALFASSTSLFNNSVLNGSYYSAIDCTRAYPQSGYRNIGCMGWINDFNLTLFDDYRYLWVYSTKPVKNLVHRQSKVYETKSATTTGFFADQYYAELDNFSKFDFLSYTPDKMASLGTSTLINPFTQATSTESIYVTRIDLRLCHVYNNMADYEGNIFRTVINFLFQKDSKCPRNVDSPYLNNIIFDSSSSNTNAVFVYGMRLTSGQEDFTKYTMKKLAVDILGSVYDPANGGSIPVGANGVAIGGNNSFKPKANVPNSTTVKTLPSYTTSVYSAPANKTLMGGVGYNRGYSSQLADVTSYINNEYNTDKCFQFHATSTSLLADMGCVLKNTGIQFISWLLIPSTNDIETLHNKLLNASSTGFSSILFAIPMRFSLWKDLNWLPNWDSSDFASTVYVPTPGYSIYTATTTIASYYVATTTTNGYYDAPVYYATTTPTASTTTFTASGTFTPSHAQNVRVLVVGGGGNAAAYSAEATGGGTGSQVTDNGSYAVTTSPITVTVGSAGASSVFGSITSVGGNASTNTGKAGGTINSKAGGAGGLDGSGYQYGGGGASYSTAGGAYNSASKISGAGASGTVSNITGSNVTYGSGGRGGFDSRNGGTCGGSLSTTYGSGGNGSAYSAGNCGSATGISGVVIVSHMTQVNGYYDAPVYHATTTTNGYWTSPTQLDGYFTYVATSSTSGVYNLVYNNSTGTVPYLTIGFSSSTRVNIAPIKAGDYLTSKYAVGDKMLADYLAPFIAFFMILFVSWRAYKLIIL